ncbi:MAG: hypothetical protein ABI615_00240 [Chthoniobacterales bacterium]
MKNETKQNYSLRELEEIWRTYNDAMLQATRDPMHAVFTLAELKPDAQMLVKLLARARSIPGSSLSSQEIGGALPRVAYWHHRNQEVHSYELE